MPHVNIRYYPRAFTDEQKKHLAAAITTVILEHFDGTREGSISIALEPVAESDWNETVVPDMTAHRDRLIKTPAYVSEGQLGRS